MTKNVKSLDRMIRVVLGIIVLCLFFVIDNNWKYLTVIGIIPLLTGIVGYCPLYSLCKIGKKK